MKYDADSIEYEIKVDHLIIKKILVQHNNFLKKSEQILSDYKRTKAFSFLVTYRLYDNNNIMYA